MSKADEKDELRINIKNWLAKSGYPLEMHVARSFLRSGYTVSQSDFYEDHEENKLREIDVTALKWDEVGDSVRFQISCRIECKLTSSHPWVLFNSVDQSDRHPFFNFLIPDTYKALLVEALKEPKVSDRLNKNVLLNPGRVGSGLIQAFSNENNDQTYKAINSAVKSSVARAMDFNGELQKVSGKYYTGISFPTIVLDGRLFESQLEEDDEISLTEVKYGFLIWKARNPLHMFPLVYVVTKSAIDEFVDLFNETTQFFFDLNLVMEKELIKICENVHSVYVSRSFQEYLKKRPGY